MCHRREEAHYPQAVHVKPHLMQQLVTSTVVPQCGKVLVFLLHDHPSHVRLVSLVLVIYILQDDILTCMYNVCVSVFQRGTATVRVT